MKVRTEDMKVERKGEKMKRNKEWEQEREEERMKVGRKGQCSVTRLASKVTSFQTIMLRLYSQETAMNNRGNNKQ